MRRISPAPFARARVDELGRIPRTSSHEEGDGVPHFALREGGSEKLEKKPAPPWLADIANAASALDTSGDGSLVTLESVRKRYPESKAGDPYEAVWKRFFPE